MSKDVECPYCGAEQDICHDDGHGMTEDVLHQEQCIECEKMFTFTTFIMVTHTARRADCLNGGKHIWQKTHTYPKRFTKWRCKTCGEEKPLTKEEMEEVLKNDNR